MSARPSHCIGCGYPLVSGHHRGSPPAGHVRHFGRGVCDQCRRLGVKPEDEPAPQVDPPTYDMSLPYLVLSPPQWMLDGLCAQTDPDAFFPDKGGATREAQAICAGCPVQAACLDYALDHGERHGIWGGATVRERRRIIRARVA